MHGGHWSLTEELTFDVFVATLYAMPKGKAVGMSGFSVELLTIYEKGGAEQREFFDAIMSDLRQGMIPASRKAQHRSGGTRRPRCKPQPTYRFPLLKIGRVDVPSTCLN